MRPSSVGGWSPPSHPYTRGSQTWRKVGVCGELEVGCSDGGEAGGAMASRAEHENTKPYPIWLLRL